jgi:hypothetical protein
MKLLKRSFVTIFVFLFLASCTGGGDGGSPTPPPTPPTPCVLKSYDTNYPSNFMGSRQIPTASGQFDKSINRGIGLKDYYPGGQNNGCSSNAEYARLLYIKTLDKLIANGVDIVEIYEYGPINDLSAKTWTLDESNWQIPKSELKWLVETAHSKNLKVSLAWQLWPVDKQNKNISVYNSTNMPESEMVRILRGWRDVLKTMAILSNDLKIDILNLQWSAYYFPQVTKYPETATQEFLSIIDDVRTVYSGKLYMGTPRFYDKRIIQKVDAIIIPLTPKWPWTYMDDSNMSVSLLRQRYSEQIMNFHTDFFANTGMNPLSIPVIWDFNIQSRDKALSDGWVEDGFCTSPTSNGAPVPYSDPNCIQKNYVTDFSVQALAIEAAFQAISSQTQFKNYGINFSTGYWLTDTLVPSEEGFPNFSQSIRGKPAENIVRSWYKR